MRRVLALAALCILAASPAWAQQSPAAQIEALRRMVEEALKQNEDLRKRVRELEEAVSKQPPPAKEPATAVAQEPPKPPAIPEPISGAKSPWGHLQLGGALEAEVSSVRGFTGKRQSEFQLITAEFDFEADVTDWAKAELSLEWDRGSDTIKLNEGFITLRKAGFPPYVKVGRGILPFGVSTGATVAARIEDTLTLTGPLTTDVFEIKTDYMLFGLRKWGLHVGANLYNGTTNDVPGGGKQLNHYGFVAGYEYRGPLSVIAGVEWVNSVMDASGLVDAFPEFQERGRNYMPGISLHAKLGLWGFSLIAEWDKAIHKKRLCRPCGDPTDPAVPYTTYNVQPEAWQIEFGYTTDAFFDKKIYVGVNYSETASLLGAFPKKRLLGTMGIWLFGDNIRLAAEYGAEKDYSKVWLGTGAHGESWRVRLTYEW